MKLQIRVFMILTNNEKKQFLADFLKKPIQLATLFYKKECEEVN